MSTALKNKLTEREADAFLRGGAPALAKERAIQKATAAKLQRELKEAQEEAEWTEKVRRLEQAIEGMSQGPQTASYSNDVAHPVGQGTQSLKASVTALSEAYRASHKESADRLPSVYNPDVGVLPWE